MAVQVMSGQAVFARIRFWSTPEIPVFNPGGVNFFTIAGPLLGDAGSQLRAGVGRSSSERSLLHAVLTGRRSQETCSTHLFAKPGLSLLIAVPAAWQET